MKIFKTILILLVINFTTISYAQITDEDEIEETTAIGQGDRKIKSTKKQTFTPKLIENTSKTQLQSKYIFYKYKAKSEFQLQPIKPAKIKLVDPLDKLRRGYIKAGIGMYTTPLAELYYNSLRSKNSDWGINLRHISSNSSIEETGFSGLSENQAGAFYTHYSKKYSITPYTVESSDWMFNYLYEHYLKGNQLEEAKRIGNEYLKQTMVNFQFFDSLAVQKYGRTVHHIYLCHDNSINADYLPQLIQLLKNEQYSFISLGEKVGRINYVYEYDHKCS